MSGNNERSDVMPSSNDFRKALRIQFTQAEQQEHSHIDIQAGFLHQQVGGYPNRNHHIPLCCDVMRSIMREGDRVIAEPKSGEGATLTIRYNLPRLTRKSIVSAIKDYDRRGRDEFLEYHQAKRRRAKTYFICFNQTEYDLKAIVYVSLLPLNKGASLPVPKKIAKAVEKLGFTVIYTGEPSPPQQITPPTESREGKKAWRMQRTLERNPDLAAAAIRRNMKLNAGFIKCESCQFKDKNRSMFDAHHLQLLTAGERITSLEHIAVLCPTCHRWAHAKSVDRLCPLSIQEVARARRPSRD